MSRKYHPAFPYVPAPRGATYGRVSVATGCHSPYSVKRSNVVDYDYDEGGVYWGLGNGDRVWCGWNKEGLRVYVRAKTREEALSWIAEVVKGYREKEKP